MVRVEILTEGQPPRYASTNTDTIQGITKRLQMGTPVSFVLENRTTLILNSYQIDRTIFLIEEIAT